MSTNCPNRVKVQHTFFDKNFPLLAKSLSATPSHQRVKQSGSPYRRLKVSKAAPSVEVAPFYEITRSHPRTSCVGGLGGTKGGQGESPDGRGKG